nr:histidine kinase dimerization/phosphoacceptor domain -containing protein [uncultured Methanoregula sp.]
MIKRCIASLKRAGTSPRGQAILVAALVFAIILFPLWWMGTGWLSGRFIADEKISAQQYLVTVKDNCEKALRQDYNIPARLSGSMMMNSTLLDSQEDFVTYSRQFSYATEVRHILLKPKGNDAYEYSPAADAATPQTQNETANIMRLVYIGGNYWGYALITIDLPHLLQNADPLSGKSGLGFIVMDQNGQVLTGDPTVLDQDPVFADLIIPPDRTWKMGAVVYGGWESALEPKLTRLRYLGFLIIVLITLLIGLITYRHVSMGNQIREREASLLESNAHLRREIEAHREAEKALKISKKKYFTLFNSANDAVVLCARGEDPLCYPVIEVNDGTSRIMGYSRDFLLSCNLFDNVLPGSRERIPRIFEEIDRNHHATFEMDYLACDGRTLPLEMNSHLFTLEGNTVLLTVARDVSARKKTEDDLRQSVAEKDVLLKEVHHRVKNNLQVISSLIDLQAGALSDPDVQNHFRECQDRIRSIALVHENLYQSKTFSTIKAEDYIKMLVDRLVPSCSALPGVNVCYDIDDIDIDLDTAIPCGLIINELVTNALKHAFTGRDRGIIRICLKQAPDDMLTLIVEDDGKGFPESVNFQETESFGLQIVTALSCQLDADLSMTGGNGTRITLRFSKIRGKTGV